MEAAASVVGIVSFGLGLAKCLQAFIESVIEAEETIILILAEVNGTASTLKRLQDVVEQDKAASEEQHRPTAINDTAVKEISAFALDCQKIYIQIIVLIEKASMQVGEDGSKDIRPQVPPSDDPNALAVRLAAFSKNVTKLGRKIRWSWLEPRIKRCQEHLGRLKISLMLSLQVFIIAERRARPSVARILGTDDENEMRERAETLRKKMTLLRARRTSRSPSIRQPPGSDDEVNEVTVNRSVSRGASTASRHTSSTSSSSEILDDVPIQRPSSDGSEREQRPRSPRRPTSPPPILRRSRAVRAVRAFHAFNTFKIHVRKRTERKSVFRKDSTSAIFEAYLIYPFSDPSPGSSGGTAATLPMKLPFGHRRLAREVKRALRKCDPWNILLTLSPVDRVLVDRVVQQAQASAFGDTSVCLVAIDVDGYTDANLSYFESVFLSWRRMVLFVRHDLVHTEENTAEHKTHVIGGPPHFTATVRDMFRGSQHNNAKRRKLQEKLRSEEDKRQRQETKHNEERENIEKNKTEMEEDKKALEAESTRIEAEKTLLETEKIRLAEEKDTVESKNRALKNAEEALLERIEKGTVEGQLKKIFIEERAKKMIEEEQTRKMIKEELAKILEEERAKIKAAEETQKAGEAEPPLKFKDAVGRKFNFPFNLVQTWQGMEDLIKQAFLHVESIGPHVRESHYDLMDSEGQVILPSTWAATIKPGASVTMRMWPADKNPLPGPQHTQGMLTPEQQLQIFMEQHQQQRHRSHAAAQRGREGKDGVPPMIPPPGAAVEMPMGLPTRRYGGPVYDPSRHIGRRLSGSKDFVSAVSRAALVPGPRYQERMDELGEGVVVFHTAEAIDEELGLDDLKTPEQMASKDIDELLEAWTNPVPDGDHDQAHSPSP